MALSSPSRKTAGDGRVRCLAHAACSCAIKNVSVMRVLANCLSNLRIVAVNPKRKSTNDGANFDHLEPASYDRLKARLVAMGLDFE